MDVGCGVEADFLFSIAGRIREGVGIDKKVGAVSRGNIKLYKWQFTDTLPFQDESFDMVTMMAVLEHLEYPESVMVEIHRVLKQGGRLLMTVPTPAAKSILEFLAFRLGIISRDEIADHKKYWEEKDIYSLCQNTGFSIGRYKKFQFGFNSFLLAIKR
ncbi:MAG: methyltransferase domain-containing protein [Deltaproteobacteria bacterium]|nr:methyltransferase domain-containing protein [Deltaproteobacteria bacterium]